MLSHKKVAMFCHFYDTMQKVERKNSFCMIKIKSAAHQFLGIQQQHAFGKFAISAQFLHSCFEYSD